MKYGFDIIKGGCLACSLSAGSCSGLLANFFEMSVSARILANNTNKIQKNSNIDQIQIFLQNMKENDFRKNYKQVSLNLFIWKSYKRLNLVRFIKSWKI